MLHLSEVPLGAVVVCEIFHLFEHTGIYIGEGEIVELQGSGLIRAVSIARFFANRSGEHLWTAVDACGQVLATPETAQRAISQIFTLQQYDLLRNNCHRFTLDCVNRRNLPVTSFFDLKTELAQFWGCEIHWQQIRMN